MRTYQIISVSQEGHVDRVAVDSRSLGRAKVVWKNLGAEGRRDRFGDIRTIDPPEQVARCQTCPIPPEEAHCPPSCWYRLGKDKPDEDPGSRTYGCPKYKPKGYSKKKFEKAVARYGGICDEAAQSLGISRQMMYHWVQWHERTQGVINT